MKRSLIQLLAAMAGVALLIPAFAMAQMNALQGDMMQKPPPPERPDMQGVRAQFMASTTKEEMRGGIPMRIASTTNALFMHAKERAAEEIDRRVRALGNLEERVDQMKRVSEQFKGELRTTINAHLEDIEALRAKIEAGVSSSTLKEDIQSITKSYRIFALLMPQAQIAAAADKIAVMTATMSDIGIKLDERIEERAEDGTDTTELEVSLRSLSSHIDSANAHAEVAITMTADLNPDEGDQTIVETNRAALKEARAELQEARQDVQQGRADIQAILNGLKKSNIEASSEGDAALE